MENIRGGSVNACHFATNLYNCFSIACHNIPNLLDLTQIYIFSFFQVHRLAIFAKKS